MRKKALITGISGQDGSYLAEHLLAQNYEVHGLVRRVALENPHDRLANITDLLEDVTLHPGNSESYPSIFGIFGNTEFDECYHLAAKSFVAESFADGFSTMNANIMGTYYILAAILELNPKCKFYFAGSSEMFGQVSKAPQTEETPFRPRSPYGISKVAGYHLARNYRERHGIFSCSGILFNHESPRRGFEFVTRKITSTVAQIKLGLADSLTLGNLEARRDWGSAKEYVAAMHLMMQQPQPDDYVIATGETHSVREFCQIAFAQVGLDYGDYVRVDPQLHRPAEPVPLVGDPAKAKATLGWESRKRFVDIVKEMVDADLHRLER